MIQDPFCEYDIKCNGCNCNLTHPITAKIIQCPLCLTFIDVSDINLSTMDLIEIKNNKKRKKCDLNIINKQDNMNMDMTSDSNTTVTNQSISNNDGPPKKRRKICCFDIDIDNYNEQWIEYQSNKNYQFQPNRPNNNDQYILNNDIIKDLQTDNNDNTKKIVNNKKTESNSKLKTKRNKKQNVKLKYGTFKMTPITFI